jgi:hypothetical protein
MEHCWEQEWEDTGAMLHPRCEIYLKKGWRGGKDREISRGYTWEITKICSPFLARQGLQTASGYPQSFPWALS